MIYNINYNNDIYNKIFIIYIYYRFILIYLNVWLNKYISILFLIYIYILKFIQKFKKKYINIIKFLNIFRTVIQHHFLLDTKEKMEVILFHLLLWYV